MADKETPLLKQYREIKNQYKEEILFFRLGDFYEMFFDDAKIASKILGLTLTSRNREKNVEIPMAGIPYHSANSYINKLVDAGYKVAICEQVEDPSLAKGIVKREVIKVISRGTVIDVDNLDAKKNNYIASISIDQDKAYIAYIDITTNTFKALYSNIANLDSLIYRLDIKELVLTKSNYNKLEDYLNTQNILVSIRDKVKNGEKFLCEYFDILSLDSFGIKDSFLVDVCSLVLDYVLEHQIAVKLEIPKITLMKSEKFADINLTSAKNLEIFQNGRDKTTYGSLLYIIDKCKSSMGSRLIKEFLNYPLLDKNEIISRQNDVEYLINNMILKDDLRQELVEIYDLERILSKIVFGSSNAKDLVAISKTLKKYLNIKKLWENKFLDINLDYIHDIIKKIDETIVDSPPFSVREANMIRKDYSSDTLELNQILHSGNKFLIDIELREKEKTGIKNLKIKYNKIFGYFIEISKSNIKDVPDTYIRKQTLANAERYITEELKIYEDKIVNAKARLNELEYQILQDLNEYIKGFKDNLIELSNIIAYIDVIASYATVSIDNSYVKPTFNDNGDLKLINSRHPVVEKIISDAFIENDVILNNDKNFIILTGPNMAGKSTYMKQIALICIMAQIGMYVPCKSANISIIDKFLTRIGASDDIITGQSTFMVEMSEVSNILNNATKNSLIILDEVGRGTSTYDGLSLASSISTYIHDKIMAKTIFATHYHELNELEDRYPRIINYRIEVEEKNQRVIFLRKISRGSADKSYGNYVAKLAGLPNEILRESKKLLEKLEKRHILIQKTENIGQLSLFDSKNYLEDEENLEDKVKNLTVLKDEIDDIDINNLTPLKALNILQNLKEISDKIEI
ncbi:DNA mismatch repair protein MutS [Oceanivirga miroungae]|uniref:DNA mismatch repair protein MutS n=1 Tax=Oceanivirga miroungae TaxID=1130046 RepID=A0A6I8MBH2_9FUSO|nr:DNA mismatch repair protein MutS [Oceanivirga miroungae]VWL85596.1 DNA mismatch repair protein MutS [Oceanivirga miroungae]